MNGVLQMDLSKKLDKFKQQQANCQNTLTKVTASRPTPKNTTTSNSSSAKKPQAPAPSSAQQLQPQLKFSNDTERLQHINSMRKLAVGAEIKRVIDLLFEVARVSLRFFRNNVKREVYMLAKCARFLFHFLAFLQMDYFRIQHLNGLILKEINVSVFVKPESLFTMSFFFRKWPLRMLDTINFVKIT